MKKSILFLSALSVLTCSIALAGPPTKKPAGKAATKTAKIVDVWTCPIEGGPVKDKKDKGVLVANKYRAHFCCAGCPEKFAKLSDKEKLAAVEKANKSTATHKM